MYEKRMFLKIKKAALRKAYSYVAIISLFVNSSSPFLVSFQYVAYAEEDGAVYSDPTPSEVLDQVEVVEPPTESEDSAPVEVAEVEVVEDDGSLESQHVVTDEELTKFVEEELTAPTSVEVESQDGEILSDGVSDYRSEGVEDSPIFEKTTETLPINSTEEKSNEERLCIDKDQEISISTDDDWILVTSENSAETKQNVTLGVRYVFPIDTGVSVTFTCLPEDYEDRSILKIHKVKIEDLDLPEAVETDSEYAYDITTDMEDGTFEYDLTLPKIEGSEASVSYIEATLEEIAVSEIELEDLKNISTDKLEQSEHSGDITVTGLNHFSIYLVINTYSDNTYIGTNKTSYTQGETVYSKATGLIESNSKYYTIRILDPNNNSVSDNGCNNKNISELTHSYTLSYTDSVDPDWEAVVYEYGTKQDCEAEANSSGEKSTVFAVTEGTAPVYPFPTYDECVQNYEGMMHICHATRSQEHPYNLLYLPCNALYSETGQGGHISNNGSTLAGHEDDVMPDENLLCPGDLEPQPVCGDGVLDISFEECDDGNIDNNDGCSSSCSIEVPECTEGQGWATEVIDFNQGTTRDGEDVTDTRSDPYKSLGEDDGLFFSLGYNGNITLSFEQWVVNTEGNDLSFHEVTWGDRSAYGVEKAEVFVSQDGESWVSIGEVTNQDNGDGVSYKDISSTGWAWIKFVKLVDTTEDPVLPSDADGYDLDALDVVYGVCDEPDDSPLGVCGDGNVNSVAEQCDDGNENDKDYCSNRCEFNHVCLPDVNMIVNGDFESPEVANEALWDIFNMYSPLLGWHISWNSVPASFGDQIRPEPAYLELHRGVNGWVPLEGEQYAELDTDWAGPYSSLNGEPSTVKISQFVPLVTGYKYAVEFNWSPRPETSASNNVMDFVWDGNTEGFFTTNGSSNTSWNNESFTFVADKEGPVEIAFIEQGTPDSLGMFLDNVSVTCLGPEKDPICGDGVINQDWEECDDVILSATSFSVSKDYFCTSTCKKIPLYDGTHECSVGTAEVKVGEISLSSTDSDGEDFSLTLGNEYLFKVSGQYSYNKNSAGNLADASYATRDGWVTTREDIGNYGLNRGVTSVLGDFGLGLGVIEWDEDGIYNDTHTYSWVLKPMTNNISFVISDWYDRWYDANPYCNDQGCMSDNDGSLTVEIYECRPVSDVTVCKYDVGDNPLSGWRVFLKGKSVDSFDVLADGSSITRNYPLGDYLVLGSGTYNYGDSRMIADPANSFRYAALPCSGGVDGWVNGDSSVCLNHYLSLNPSLSSGPVVANWGLFYNPEHVYAQPFKGGDLNLKIWDSCSTTGEGCYGDNEGSLQVQVFEGFAGDTGEKDGCITFEDVPLGTYELGEVMRENWMNIGGIGSVEVDSPLETFDIYNKEKPVDGSITVCKYNDLNTDGKIDNDDPKISWDMRIVRSDKKDIGQVWDVTTPQGDCVVLESMEFGSYDVTEALVEGWESTYPVGTDTQNVYLDINSPDVTVNFLNRELPSTTIRATKIVCDNESDLPNWGKSGGPNITPIVIQNFLNTHRRTCRVDSGWEFQWSGPGDANKVNPGDNSGVSFDENWHTFGPTDITGVAEVEIYNLSELPYVWVREAWKDTYVPFSYNLTKPAGNENKVSAEIYCHTDALNYDNLDRVDGLKTDSIYYCVAFNALNAGSIQGRKYEDINGNGFYNMGEPYLDGWGIRLYDSEWKFISQMQTGDDSTPAGPVLIGQYRFDNLPLGTYYTCEVKKPGWNQTEPSLLGGFANLSGFEDEFPRCRRSVITEPDETVTGKVFGNTQGGDIHGYKWNDMDGDGSRNCLDDQYVEDSYDLAFIADRDFDSDCQLEPLMGGWEIFIDKNGNSLWDESEPKTRTYEGDSDDYGWYWFENLPLGHYRVCEVSQLGWVQTSSPECYEVDLPDTNPLKMVVSPNYVDPAPVYSFGNQSVVAGLTLAKFNYASGPLNVGDRVTFEIRVTAHDNKVVDINVEDLYSDGFSYVPESWSAGTSHGRDLRSLNITTEPTYASPGEWYIDYLEPGEVATLTYLAEVTDEVDPGIYKDIAWAVGKDLSGASVPGYAEEDGNKINERFVGTEVEVESGNPSPAVETEVDEDEVEEEVLGSSTIRLPATGSPTVLVYFALVLGVLGLYIVLTSRKKRASLFWILTILTFGIASRVSYAESSDLIVRLEEPESVVNGPFNITFVAMDILGNRELTAYCEKDGPSDLDWVEFDSKPLIMGGTTDVCEVLSSDLNGNGVYKFRLKLVAEWEDSISQIEYSKEVTTEFDSDFPDKPKYIEVDRKSDCKYEIEFKTADDGQTSYAEVYMSNDKEFTANEHSRIRTITIGPNTKHTFTEEVAGDKCSERQYFAVRAFDSAGNGSKVEAEEITDIKTTTVYKEGETEVIGALPSGSPSVIGGSEGTEEGSEVVSSEEELPEGAEIFGEEEGSVLGEATDEEDKQKGFLGKLFSSPWSWIAVIAVLGAITINAIRKKK